MSLAVSRVRVANKNGLCPGDLYPVHRVPVVEWPSDDTFDRESESQALSFSSAPLSKRKDDVSAVAGQALSTTPPVLEIGPMDSRQSASSRLG